MKKVMWVFALLVFLLSLAFSASATTTATRVQRSLEFSGTSAICSATITDIDKSISATMELWCGNVPLASWSDSGTSSVNLSGSINVPSSMTFTLKLYGTVDGVPFELPPLVRSN